MVVNVGWSQLRTSRRQQDWSYGSLLMTRTALHACCKIVVISATMCVQNYALLKVLLRLTLDLFALFVQQ